MNSSKNKLNSSKNKLNNSKNTINSEKSWLFKQMPNAQLIYFLSYW